MNRLSFDHLKSLWAAVLAPGSNASVWIALCVCALAFALGFMRLHSLVGQDYPQALRLRLPGLLATRGLQAGLLLGGLALYVCVQAMWIWSLEVSPPEPFHRAATLSQLWPPAVLKGPVTGGTAAGLALHLASFVVGLLAWRTERRHAQASASATLSTFERPQPPSPKRSIVRYF